VVRTYARLPSSIWDDDEWRNLSRSAQWMYMFLWAQPDLASNGTLALRVRRWATLTHADEASLWTAIDELEQARFVAVDVDLEELLIPGPGRRAGGP
jgi:hypothetical protein